MERLGAHYGGLFSWAMSLCGPTDMGRFIEDRDIYVPMVGDSDHVGFLTILYILRLL